MDIAEIIKADAELKAQQRGLRSEVEALAQRRRELRAKLDDHNRRVREQRRARMTPQARERWKRMIAALKENGSRHEGMS